MHRPSAADEPGNAPSEKGEAPSSVPPAVKDQARPRDEVFDLAKGIGIIAVVMLHVSGRSATLLYQRDSSGWWAMKWINLFVNFCVPLFLLVSAILLARSASKENRPDWIRFARRRLRSVVLPLVVWSVIYWLLRRFIEHDSRVMSPGFWLDFKARFSELIFGKAEFHLYFLSVLAQLCLVLPFFVLLFRRVRMNVWMAVLFAIVMQLAAYLLHKAWPYDNPGSVILWYLSTVLPGIWLGMNWKEWPTIRSKSWGIWLFFSVGGFALIGYETWLFLANQNALDPGTKQLLASNATAYNLAPFIYALGAPILILALLSLWGEGGGRFRVLLRRLGEMSLQIYLMHPILLEWLGKSWRLDALRWLPLPSLLFFLAVLFGTYGISLLFERIGVLNPVLFGRDAPGRARESR